MDGCPILLTCLMMLTMILQVSPSGLRLRPPLNYWRHAMTPVKLSESDGYTFKQAFFFVFTAFTVFKIN